MNNHPANIHANQRHAGHFARALVVAWCCWGALQGHAAMLGNGAPQQTVDGIAIPVTLFPAQGDNIASMQFRLIYDTRAFALAGAVAGPAAAQAGKDVIYAQHSGSATIIVAGFNQDILQGGLVATIYLQPLGDLKLPNAINIQSAVFSDPFGQAIVRQTPGNNPTDPDPSTKPDPVDNDDKSTPPPVVPVDDDADDPDPTTPDNNYVNPGYGARYLDDNGNGTFGENKAGAQASENDMRDVTRPATLNAGIGIGSGGGVLPGAPGERQPYDTDPSGTGITLQLPQNVASASPPLSARRPGFARNTGMPSNTPESATDSSTTSGVPRSGVPGALAANTFQNGTKLAKPGLNLDSNAATRGPNTPNNLVPLLLALIVTTLFVGGAYYWRQAAPRARR